MLDKELIAGADYAFAQKPGNGRSAPPALRCVTLVSRVKPGRWTVRETDSGTTFQAQSGQLVVPWAEAAAWTANRDKVVQADQSRRAAEQRFRGTGEEIEYRAMKYLLDATGDDLMIDDAGVVSGYVSSLERVCRRAGLAIPTDTVVIESRYAGEPLEVYLAFATMLPIMQAFCKAEAVAVRQTLQAIEADLDRDNPPGTSWNRYVQSDRAALRLAQDWST